MARKKPASTRTPKAAPRRTHAKRTPGSKLAAAVMLFYLTAFTLLGLKDMAWQAFAFAAGVPAAIWLGVRLLPHLFPVDELLLCLTNFLCALGMLMLYATSPALAYRQAIYYGVGLAAMAACALAVRLVRSWQWPLRLLMPLSLALLALPLLFGRETNGATNWIYFGSVSVQPSELVKLTLLLTIAWSLSRRRHLPWLAFCALCLGMLMLHKDLGTALLYYGTALLLFYASTGSLFFTLLGFGGAGGAAVMGYRMFAHVKRRVAVWRNPWADYENAGYQTIHGLMALASGGLIGIGLGLGAPRSIPVFETDFIFAVICEQFGLIFGLCVLAVYAVLVWRGASIAVSARRSFHGLLAMGAAMMLGLQTFIIIGGVLKLIPLTGVTMPFVSSGGSSMVSSMALIGLMQGVDSITQNDLQNDIRLATYGDEPQPPARRR